ncbi:MAG: PorP/SprF family type IX secretion system membrane protein [Chitinophagaceae bacterium]|nr:PorP/SprF family type IX secretion system membrane protein [Chitinophagaceae bacterium]MCW5926744.1 PorP/SprF family type IX secretion system membrane protein [Chitinophagaceae bacterium]
MKKKIWHILFTIFIVAIGKLNAQVDPHFSQYFIQPMFLNPALTGAIEGDYRVSAIWRSQYNNTFNTQGVAAEMVTNKNLNIGLNVLNQMSSGGAYNFTNAQLSVAYTGIRFNNHFVTMAMQAGMLNRRFNVNKLQFGDQWLPGIGFDHNLPTTEVFTKPSASAFDAGAGILYYDATPDRSVNLFAGAAAFHLTQPQDPFISGTSENGKLPIRYSAHAGARILVNDFVNLVPNVLYMRQGNAEEKMVGAYLQIKANEKTDLMLGANWRMGDAASPFGGFYYNGFTVGISYDVTASTKDAMAINRNSLEVSLSYTWWRKKATVETKPFFCPRF